MVLIAQNYNKVLRDPDVVGCFYTGVAYRIQAENAYRDYYVLGEYRDKETAFDVMKIIAEHLFDTTYTYKLPDAKPDSEVWDAMKQRRYEE